MSYKWYNRKRLYEYGYYDIKKKRYYNEDSGKWVSRLNNIVIDEKYIRYEFSYWDEREIEKIFGYDLVERIGRFLFLLYKKGLCEYLDVSIGKVEKMMYDDGLKYVKFGRNVRFDINDVNDYMNNRKIS